MNKQRTVNSNGARESLQGAVAAGLLAVRDQFVGTVEQVGPLLIKSAEDPRDMDATCAAIVARLRGQRQLVPAAAHAVGSAQPGAGSAVRHESVR